eukprot:Nitzschia sp. Nitz4//scaffold29_size155292//36158//36861//NITZ4_002643-RA/size155292-augustus-gene-0.201-mRNA-1//1//CDS//3329546403//9250//frame0
MTSIDELFPKCKKLSYDARQQLSQVQNGVLHASELFLSLDELSNQLNIMDQLVLRETPARREGWKRKIQELREDAMAIRRQGEHYDRTVNTKVRHQKERDELLRQRRNRREFNNGDEKEMADLADEAKSWQQSQSMMSDLLASGEASFASLVHQRQQLRGISRFLGQISDSLGISQATMKIIERRDITDAYFVLGGCVITCIVIYFVWF